MNQSVCVLLCLAFVQVIAANIFKRWYTPPAHSVNIQPIELFQRPLYLPFNQTLHYKKLSKTKDEQWENHKINFMNKHTPSNLHQTVHALQVTNENRSSHQTTEYSSEVYTILNPRRKWNPIHPTTAQKVHQQLQEQLDSGDTVIWRTLEMPMTNDVTQYSIKQIYSNAYKVMPKSSAKQKAKFQEDFTAALRSQNEGRYMNASELLTRNNYIVDEHTIKTEDGYYLTLFRMAAKKELLRKVFKKSVVFLMHGFLGSADDWLLLGPGKSLAYLLSDGYDVWLGNARGNRYSQRHVSKHPALTDFWQFSNDEVALVDLPSMIDYVLGTTGQEKLHYIAHSSGTTNFFALASASREYNDKFISMHALAPMAYMNDARSPLLRMLSTRQYENVYLQIGRASFNPKPDLISMIGGDICDTQIGDKQICSNVYFAMTGVNIESLDPRLAPSIIAHLPAGGSTRMIKQFSQAVVSHGLRKYNFGARYNKKVYGSVYPPRYEMQQIEVPVTLYYATADWLAHPTDVMRLQRDLPHVTTHQVSDPYFTHMDFQFSPRAPHLIYKHIMNSIAISNDLN